MCIRVSLTKPIFIIQFWIESSRFKKYDDFAEMDIGFQYDEVLVWLMDCFCQINQKYNNHWAMDVTFNLPTAEVKPKDGLSSVFLFIRQCGSRPTAHTYGINIQKSAVSIVYAYKSRQGFNSKCQSRLNQYSKIYAIKFTLMTTNYYHYLNTKLSTLCYYVLYCMYFNQHQSVS